MLVSYRWHPNCSLFAPTALTLQGSILALVFRHRGLWKTTEGCFLAFFFPFFFLLMRMHLLHLLLYLSLLGSLFAFEPCLAEDNGPRLGTNLQGMVRTREPVTPVLPGTTENSGQDR